jgi:formiminoglutamase
VRRGNAPLLLSLPHTGTDIPPDIEARLVSPWLARKDTDWWIDRLYGFAADLDATLIRTLVSRTVIDVNRDPSGLSLYPGRPTTELCPTTTFDGETLSRTGREVTPDEVAQRRTTYFDPYHAVLANELERLRGFNGRVVLYDCHSIRSVVPRLFEGLLPQFCIGTSVGQSCDPALTEAVETACDASGLSRVTDGRFRGGYITRHYGAPWAGVHAIQMELACRGYMREKPGPVAEGSWPAPYVEAFAAPCAEVLRRALEGALAFART